MELITNAILTLSNFLKGLFYFNVLKIFRITTTELPLIIFCIVAVSFIMLIQYKFRNFRYFIYGIKAMFSGSDDESVSSDKIKSFRAVFTAVAGSTGLGSIAGVAIAIAVGGPGSIIWMILMPFFCMPIRFTEVFLAHKYRVTSNQGYDGGPQYYIKYGFADIGFKKLGIIISALYSISLILSSFGGPCAFQINQSVAVLSHNFGIIGFSKILLTIAFSVFAFLILIGGIGRISKILSTIVPIIISVYFISAMVVIAANYANIPVAIHDIFVMAFSLKSAYGGILGAFVVGATRSIVASEIAMGTASIVHANVANKSSIKEGLLAMSAPVIEILFVSSVTGILVTITNVYKDSAMGAVDVYHAFSTVSSWFPYIIMIIVPIMGLNVMIAWGFFGQRMVSYYFGNNAGKIFLVLYVFCGFIGGIINNVDVIVALLDTITIVMVFPNLIGLLFLTRLTWKEFKNFTLSRDNIKKI